MKPRQVPYINLQAQYQQERTEILAEIDAVFAQGKFVGSDRVGALEEELRDYCGGAHVVCLNSGTDALILALEGLGIGPGDEVITPPNSFIASTAAIIRVGARPVFVDVLPDQNIDPDRIKAAISPKTKAIMPVHLTGRMADMVAIMEIAREHDLRVIEDAAQSIGSKYHGELSGTVGDAGCFSAHPLKNLNAAGDAGFLVTKDGDLARYAALVRNHGLEDRNTVSVFGTVSRMDSLQAAILSLRLKKLEEVQEARRTNASVYRQRLNPDCVYMPPCRSGEFNTFHTFVVQVEQRDALRAYLLENGVKTGIHYPVPIHLQPAAKKMGYVPGDFPVTESQAERILSLPIHQFLTKEDIFYVSDLINAFFENK